MDDKYPNLARKNSILARASFVTVTSERLNNLMIAFRTLEKAGATPELQDEILKHLSREVKYLVTVLTDKE